jgi:hypothetical protein
MIWWPFSPAGIWWRRNGHTVAKLLKIALLLAATSKAFSRLAKRDPDPTPRIDRGKS